MAKSMFFNLALILSLLLIVSVAESRSLGQAMVTFPAGGNPTLKCRSVIDVKNADNCEALEKKFNLSKDGFESFNPNLNCNALFIGQWLCIDAFLAV